jgi:hypothetical protein
MTIAVACEDGHIEGLDLVRASEVRVIPEGQQLADMLTIPTLMAGDRFLVSAHVSLANKTIEVAGRLQNLGPLGSVSLIRGVAHSEEAFNIHFSSLLPAVDSVHRHAFESLDVIQLSLDSTLDKVKLVIL